MKWYVRKTIIVCLAAVFLPQIVLAYDQYESMKVGETKTFYFPSEVTSRSTSMYAYNCTSDHINNVEVVSYTKTSVTVKALAYTQYTVNIRFDYWWYENNYGRSDTHMVHIDLNDNGYSGSSSEDPADYTFDYGSWGTINIEDDERVTLYSNISPPNPDKLVSVIWSDYHEYGYEIISQSKSSCTIKGAFPWEGAKLWCLWKYGNATYKNYYIINVKASSKEFLSLSANPAGGKVSKGKTVLLTASQPGSTIYYTLNGNNPTSNSTQYTSSGITINQSCTLKAFAWKSGYRDSPIMTWEYTVSDDVIAEINETTFPDPSFRNWILEQDYGKDGKLTENEIANVTAIDVSGSYNSYGSISSLKGIEYFTALETLDCRYNQLVSLDVSKNTVLNNLYCSGNKLSVLDVSKNTALTNLLCGDNQLASLDVSKNTSLWQLWCFSNQLTSLNVSKNTELNSINCYNNQLTTLNVSKNTKLTDLTCSNNRLTVLDVSSNSKLTTFNCSGNMLTNLDISCNTKLENLECGNNNLASLDVSVTNLYRLGCSRNKIKGIGMDVLIESLPTRSGFGSETIVVDTFDDTKGDEGNVCTKTQVAAMKNKGWTPRYLQKGITSNRWKEYEGSDESYVEINATNFPDEYFRNWLLSQDYGKDGKLTEDEINGVTEIDVSGDLFKPGSIKSLKGVEFFKAIKKLYCKYNILTTLDISQNSALRELDCSFNQLTVLDVSKNIALITLDCASNKLAALDVTCNTALREIDCWSNQLTVLDVSKNAELEILWCDINYLKNLDVTNNTKLEELWCTDNRLTTLDVSKNTALTSLWCENNKLLSLDVSKNMKLTHLTCENNQLSTLDVSENTALESLWCQENQLTSLIVSDKGALDQLRCYSNNIRGVEMDKLISSLPINTTDKAHSFRVFHSSDVGEGNVCSKTQIAAAKARGWTPEYTTKGWDWQEYGGSDDEPEPKGDVNGDGEVNGTDLVALTNIILDKSAETAAADVNGDGSVNGTDYVALTNIVLGKAKARTRAAASARLTIEPFDIKAGETKEMVIDLTNPSDELTLVQFDLRLPEGLSLEQTGGEYDIDMTGRTTWRRHSLDANQLADGSIRFLLASSSNTLIEGTEGAIIKATLVAGDDFKGGDIRLNGILLVSPDEKEVKPDDYIYKIGVGENGSGENGGGNGGENGGESGGDDTATPRLSVEPFDIKAGGTATMTIDLTNPEEEITLIQFDLRLPEGVTLAQKNGELNIDMADRTTWRRHSLDANQLADGSIRFLLASSSNTLIDGTGGAVITMNLVADASYNGGVVRLEDILLVSPDETEYKPADVSYTIGSAGIGIVTADDSGQPARIYNLSGQRLAAPQKGINIINGRKVVVK